MLIMVSVVMPHFQVIAPQAFVVRTNVTAYYNIIILAKLQDGVT